MSPKTAIKKSPAEVFFEAIAQKDTDSISEHVRQNPEIVNVQDENFNSPLHMAIINYPSLIPFLLKKGADITIRNHNEEDALDAAISQKCSPKIIIEFTNHIKKQFDAATIEEEREKIRDVTARYLIHAIIKNNIEDAYIILKLGIKIGFNINYQYGDRNRSIINYMLPIFLCTENIAETIDFFQLLVANGADLNLSDIDGRTILHLLFATETASAEILDFTKILVENGVDVNIKDDYGYNMLHYTMRHNNAELLRYFLEEKAMIRVINDANINGDTVLNLARKFGVTDEIKTILIEKGAKFLEEEDKIKESSISNICRRIYSRDAGKDFDLQDFDPNILDNIDINGIADSEDKPFFGKTPLFIAIQKRRPNFVKILIAKGANLETKCDGKTPLVEAVRLGYDEIAKDLIASGANYQEIYDGTRMIVTSKDSEKNKQLQEFLETIIHPEKTTISGTGLHLIATHCLNNNALEKFSHHNINIHKRNINNNSPFIIAAALGKIWMVEYFLKAQKPQQVLEDLCEILQKVDIMILIDSNVYRAIKQVAITNIKLSQDKDEIELWNAVYLKCQEQLGQKVITKEPLLLKQLEEAMKLGAEDAIKKVMKAEESLIASHSFKQTKKIKESAISQERMDVLTFIAHNKKYNKFLETILKYSQKEMADHRFHHIIFNEAAANNNLEMLKMLFEKGFTFTERGIINPLHCAVMNEHSEIVEYLSAEKKFDLEERYRDLTSLLHAANQKNYEIFRTLIRNGANINAVSDGNNKISILIMAILTGNVDFVKLILSEPNVNVNQIFKLEQEDLMNPVQLTSNSQHENSAEILRLLLQYRLSAKPANIDTQDQQGMALYLAIRKKSVEKTKILLANGAVPGLIKKIDDLFSEYNLRNGDDIKIRTEIDKLIDMFSSLTKSLKNGETALHIIARYGNVTTLDKMLRKGDYINIQNHNSLTALHIAVKENNSEVAARLIEKGADVNIANRNGLTALHLAAFVGNDTNIKDLMKYGANINARNNSGLTALHNAITGKHKSTILILLQQGIDVNSQDDKGNSALHNIMSHPENIEIIKILLINGADINLKNQEGKSVLDIALENNLTNILQLFKVIANLQELTIDGQNILHILARYGNGHQIRNILTQNKIDINIKDKEGNSALHYAIEAENHEVIMTLLLYGAEIDITKIGGLRNEEIRNILEVFTNPQKTTKDGKTALHMIAKSDNVELMAKYLSANFDLNKTDKNSNTALYVACIADNFKMVNFILNRGINVSKGEFARILKDAGNEEIKKTIRENEMRITRQKIQKDKPIRDQRTTIAFVDPHPTNPLDDNEEEKKPKAESHPEEKTKRAEQQKEKRKRQELAKRQERNAAKAAKVAAEEQQKIEREKAKQQALEEAQQRRKREEEKARLTSEKLQRLLQEFEFGGHIRQQDADSGHDSQSETATQSPPDAADAAVSSSQIISQNPTPQLRKEALNIRQFIDKTLLRNEWFRDKANIITFKGSALYKHFLPEFLGEITPRDLDLEIIASEDFFTKSQQEIMQFITQSFGTNDIELKIWRGSKIDRNDTTHPIQNIEFIIKPEVNNLGLPLNIVIHRDNIAHKTDWVASFDALRMDLYNKENREEEQKIYISAGLAKHCPDKTTEDIISEIKTGICRINPDNPHSGKIIKYRMAGLMGYPSITPSDTSVTINLGKSSPERTTPSHET